MWFKQKNLRKYCVKMLVNTPVLTALLPCILQKFTLFKLSDPVCKKMIRFLFLANEARLGALRGQQCKKMMVFSLQGILDSTLVCLYGWNFEKILVRRMQEGWRPAKTTNQNIPKLRRLRRVRIANIRLILKNETKRLLPCGRGALFYCCATSG